MTFIRDAWYAAARSDELGASPLARTILGEPVVLFRTDHRAVGALLDVCPHRAVPLHLGRVVRDHIVCPYHGLEFDVNGVCRLNPHTKGPSDRICAEAFPVSEQHGFVWVWMGEPSLGDPAAVPDYSLFHNAAGFAAGGGYTHVNADYRLIIDNLLDLSHAEYVHPNTVGNVGASQFMQQTTERSGHRVTSKYLLSDQPPSPVMSQVWSRSPTVDQWSDMTWTAPSHLVLDLGIMPPGASKADGIRLPSAHILTPETETSTHYFWSFARDFDTDNEQLTAAIIAFGAAAFTDEDKPMIEAAQTVLSRSRPTLRNFTGGDAASMQARRILDELSLSATSTRREPTPA